MWKSLYILNDYIKKKIDQNLKKCFIRLTEVGFFIESNDAKSIILIILV